MKTENSILIIAKFKDIRLSRSVILNIYEDQGLSLEDLSRDIFHVIKSNDSIKYDEVVLADIIELAMLSDNYYYVKDICEEFNTILTELSNLLSYVKIDGILTNFYLDNPDIITFEFIKRSCPSILYL